MRLIRGLFLTSGFVLNVCSAHRRAFLTGFHGLSHADFSLFSSFCYPVSFLAGLWWTAWHRKKRDAFALLQCASLAGLAFFLATSLPFVAANRAFVFLCMFSYVGCMAGLMPVICIECFDSLKDRRYFGQNLMLAYVGNVFMALLIRIVCPKAKIGSGNWSRLYFVALATHLCYLASLSLMKSHSSFIHSAKEHEALANEEEQENEPLPIFFQNTPWETNMSGSSFSSSARTLKKLPLAGVSTEKLWENSRYLCILTCGFFVSLSTNLMKIALPTFLEEHLKMRSWMESFVSTLGTGAEFAILLAFPKISNSYSYQGLFLISVSLYFLYLSLFCVVGKLGIGLELQLLLYSLNVPLKGASLGLMQCVAPLCISQECGKRSNGQKVYSAVVSMAAGFIAGLFGYWIAVNNRTFDLESSAVFRHCIFWCFVALLIAVWMFLFRDGEARAKKISANSFRYEALLIDNLYSE
jgi:MFS family permease